MLSLVEDALARFHMLDGAAEVTVALSGGADSVALLDVMLRLREKYGFGVTAAHLNHRLRGAESDGDEEFVRKLCGEREVPLFAERRDIAGIAERTGRGIEETAREERYSFLGEVAPGKIATAHTSDDNAETVLFRLARGTGPDGLRGIPPVRGDIIRPLILCARADVEEYCRERGLSYRTDSSNFDTRYARNRVRRDVMPALREINPAVSRHITALSGMIDADSELLRAITDAACRDAANGNGLSVEKLLSYPEALSARVLRRRCMERCGQELSGKHLEAVFKLLSDGTKTELSGGCAAVRVKGRLEFEPPPAPGLAPIALGPGDGLAENGYLEFRYDGSKKFNKLVFKNSLDYAKIVGMVTLRTRLPGDAYRPLGRPLKPLKKLFNEVGLTPGERARRLVLADEVGIIWVEGFGADERLRVTSDTPRYVTVICKEH